MQRALLASSDLRDNVFERPNDATGLGRASSGALWTTRTGTPQVSSGRIVAPGGANAIATVPGFADVAVAARIAALPSNQFSVIARVTDTNNYFRVRVQSTGVLWLTRILAGAATDHHISGAGFIVAGDTIEIRAVGTLISAYKNGTLWQSSTDSTLDETETKIGVQMVTTTGCADLLTWRSLS